MSNLEIPEDLDLSNLTQKEKLVLLDKVSKRIMTYIQRNLMQIVEYI